eukprot:1144557-Pyramimonas_sp.AAC.1
MRAPRPRRPRAHVEIQPQPPSPTRGHNHRHRRAQHRRHLWLSAVTVLIAARIAAAIIASAFVDVARTPRPPESPTRTEVPACQRGLRVALG